MQRLVLATDTSLRGLDERCRGLFTAQMQRLVPALDALTPAQWQAPSRNRGWTVHHTMQHVAGVRIENARIIDGGEPTWSSSFDPHRSPQADIDRRAGESPAETVQAFRVATMRMIDHMAACAGSDERRPTVWGDPADFRLFHLHVFWDSFVHERDMFLPLGVVMDPDDETVAFATAYAVLTAGVPLRRSDGRQQISLAVDGVGRVELTVEGSDLRVVVDPDEVAAGAYAVADACGLIDALSGRGDVASVVDAPEDLIAALGGFGRFLHG